MGGNLFPRFSLEKSREPLDFPLSVITTQRHIYIKLKKRFSNSYFSKHFSINPCYTLMTLPIGVLPEYKTITTELSVVSGVLTCH